MLQMQSFIRELPKRDGYIDFSQLRKIGQGGTHEVFIYPKNRTFVVKLNKILLDRVIDIGQSGLSSKIRQKIKQYIKDQNLARKQLYKYFGCENCLYEKAFLKKISIHKNGVLYNIEGLILIQEASDVFKNRTKKDFSTAYIEKNRLTRQDERIYRRINSSLLGRKEFREVDFLKCNNKAKSIFELIDRDKLFLDCVREFLLKFKKYFQSSGRFIDLVGQENVLFYRKGNKWAFRLGSVLKVESRRNIENVLKILEKNPEQLDADRELKNILMNCLAFIRVLNATGLKVGIGKIVDISLSGIQLENLEKVKFY